MFIELFTWPVDSSGHGIVAAVVVTKNAPLIVLGAEEALADKIIISG